VKDKIGGCALRRGGATWSPGGLVIAGSLKRASWGSISKYEARECHI
jgi:hypothetical protein